jgi:hypothetical protein
MAASAIAKIGGKNPLVILHDGGGLLRRSHRNFVPPSQKISDRFLWQFRVDAPLFQEDDFPVA